MMIVAPPAVGLVSWATVLSLTTESSVRSLVTHMPLPAP
jgi:hypothetical protein